MTDGFVRIPGYSGYEVNVHGEIRSWIANRVGHSVPHTMSPAINEDGYSIVSLKSDAGPFRSRSVHLLMMAAFVGPHPGKGYQIRHLDGNPQNNNIENLRYGTVTENMLDQVRHKTNSQTRKTRCARGHEFDVVFIARHTGRAARRCRKCKAINTANYRARSKAKSA